MKLFDLALVLVFSLALNMVQTAKDVQKCKKSNFEARGCSVYKKLNMEKKKDA